MSNANCSSIFYDDGQLQIAGGVRGGETLVRISFASALLVRIADEGLRLQLLDQLGGSRGSLLKWSQSELIDWVSVESVGTKCDGLQHFTVLLGEEIVDVITADLPKVEFAGA